MRGRLERYAGSHPTLCGSARAGHVLLECQTVDAEAVEGVKAQVRAFFLPGGGE